MRVLAFTATWWPWRPCWPAWGGSRSTASSAWVSGGRLRVELWREPVDFERFRDSVAESDMPHRTCALAHRVIPFCDIS